MKPGESFSLSWELLPFFFQEKSGKEEKEPGTLEHFIWFEHSGKLSFPKLRLKTTQYFPPQIAPIVCIHFHFLTPEALLPHAENGLWVERNQEGCFLFPHKSPIDPPPSIPECLDGAGANPGGSWVLSSGEPRHRGAPSTPISHLFPSCFGEPFG